MKLYYKHNRLISYANPISNFDYEVTDEAQIALFQNNQNAFFDTNDNTVKIPIETFEQKKNAKLRTLNANLESARAYSYTVNSKEINLTLSNEVLDNLKGIYSLAQDTDIGSQTFSILQDNFLVVELTPAEAKEFCRNAGIYFMNKRAIWKGKELSILSAQNETELNNIDLNV